MSVLALVVIRLAVYHHGASFLNLLAFVKLTKEIERKGNNMNKECVFIASHLASRITHTKTKRKELRSALGLFG